MHKVRQRAGWINEDEAYNSSFPIIHKVDNVAIFVQLLMEMIYDLLKTE